MRKIVLRVITLLSMLGCGQVVATTGELRTPLARFPYHHELMPVDDGLWSFNTFASCFERCADQGYGACNSNKVSLSTLFFGKDSFRGEEAFYGGALTLASAPAALRFVNMHPRFSYSEKGVNFAVETEKRWDCSSWRVGAQLSMPFKCIDVERNVCSATMTDMSESFSGAVCHKSETLWKTPTGAGGSLPSVREPKAIVPAYRLDFLSSLCRSDGMPMVEYGIQTVGADHQGSVRIAGIEVAGTENAGQDAVAVLQNVNSVCPSAYQYATPTAGYIASIPLGRPAVSGIDDLITNHFVTEAGGITAPQADSRGAFTTGQNYTALGANFAEQAQLYIVPIYKSDWTTVGTDEFADTRFTDHAVIIMNAIEAAISDLEINGAIQAEQYFYEQGVHFCQTKRMTGLGDMDLDFYAAYDFTKDFWGKFVAGVVFPTGKKICDPLDLLAQAPGNNGHFEIKLGADFGWKACKWCAFDLDASYNFVLEAKEWRGAPFKGATVKNIGPKIQAKTKWGYFTGHFDVTFFHPENQNLGFSLGYEAYVKQCDKIKFCGDCSTSCCSTSGCSTTGAACSTTTAVQFPIAGCCGACAVQNLTAVELDASLLAVDTKRISNKIRGEVFHRWSYCELFAGASSVFAGKNIMKELECHLGCGIYW